MDARLNEIVTKSVEILAWGLTGKTWAELDEFYRDPPGTTYNWFSSKIVGIVEPEPEITGFFRKTLSVLSSYFWKKVPRASMTQERKNFLEMVQHLDAVVELQGGLARTGNNREKYLELWRNVANIFSLPVGHWTHVVANPLELSTEGEVLTAIMSAKAILKMDDESLGYVVPNLRMTRALGDIENILSASRRRFDLEGATLALQTFAHATQPVMLDQNHFFRNDGGVSVGKLVIAEVDSLVSDRRIAFNDLWASRQAPAVRASLIEAFNQYLNRVTQDIMTFNMNYWSVYVPDQSMNTPGRQFRKFEASDFNGLRKRKDLPVGGRIRFRVVAHAQSNEDDGFYGEYNDYIINNRILSPERRQEMINALVLMRDRLRNMFERKLIYYVNLFIVQVLVDENGIAVRGTEYDRSLPHPYKFFEEWCAISMNQLAAPSAEGLRVLEQQRDNNELHNYGFSTTNDTLTFYNLFDLAPVYVFPQLTLAKHADETTTYYFVSMSCLNSEEGECILKAFEYMTPVPTKEELIEMANHIFAHDAPLSERLSIVKSIPWLCVSSLSNDFTWEVEGASSEELKTQLPWTIDLNKVAVLCTKNNHMYRVTKINKPTSSFLIIDEVCQGGCETLITALMDSQLQPTAEEIDQLKLVIKSYPLHQAMKFIKSVPFKIVSNPRRGYKWKEICCTKYHEDPKNVDLDSTIVIVRLGDAYLRVKGIQFLTEHIDTAKFAIEGFLTVHCDDIRTTNRAIEALNDSFRKPQIGEIPLRILQDKFAAMNIAQLIKLIGSDDFKVTCFDEYAKEDLEAKINFPNREDILKALNDPYSVLSEVIGLPIVSVVEPINDAEWKVLYCSQANYHLTPAKAVSEFDHHIVLARHKGVIMRVVDYHITISDGLPFPQFFSARRNLAISRGDTYAHTIEMINPSFLSSEETLALQQDIKAIKAIKSRKWAIIKGFKLDYDKSIKEVVYESKSKDFSEPNFEEDIIFWKDADETLFLVAGFCEYDCPNIYKKEEPKPPIIITYDFETGNSEYTNGKNQSTLPIILHACSDLGEGKPKDYSFEGPSCSVLFASWLIEQRDKIGRNREIIISGFNSSKFDLFVLLPGLVDCPTWHLGKEGHDSTLVKAGSKLLELAYENFKFIDERRFLMTSLGNAAKLLGCKSAKTGWNHQLAQDLFASVDSDALKFLEALKTKKASDFIHGDIALEGKTAYEAYHSYCANDCEVTLEVLKKLRDGYFEMTSGKMDIYKSMTLPQAVYKFAMKSIADRGIKLYHTKTAEEYLCARQAILAGQSQVYDTAPKGMVQVLLLLLDIISMYPFVMHQCWYPIDSETHPVKTMIPNKLGIYLIRITKQANPVVIPLKAKDSGLGGHFWYYEGEYEVWATVVDIRDHLFFGGECEINRGFVFDKMQRGIMTPVIDLFKNVKQEQDRLKSLGLPFNSAWRQAAKDGSNNLSGKFVQDLNLDKSFLIAENTRREEFEKEMRKTYGDTAVTDMFLSASPPETFEEQLQPYNKAMLVEVKKDIDSVFASKNTKQVKSIVTGLFIYSWSRHHMLHGIIARAAKAKARFAIETDGLQMNMALYEKWMEENMPEVNPYDVPAPDEKELPDKIFDMPVDDYNSNLSDQRLGYFYCPVMAKNWAMRHPEKGEWFAKRAQDYGDYTVESGAYPIMNGKVPKNDGGEALGFVNTPLFEVEPIECCYLGKKCYYLSKGEDHHEKLRFKGVGNSTKDAAELVDFIEAHEGQNLSKNPEYLALLSKIDKSNCVLSKALYEKLISGQGVDVCERRFRGSLDMLGDDGCGLACDLVVKRLLPPEHMRIMIRTQKSELNPHGNTIYEQQYHGAYPRGLLPCSSKFEGVELTQAELNYIASEVEVSKKNCRGLTLSIKGKPGYLDAHSVKFIKHNLTYFSFKDAEP